MERLGLTSKVSYNATEASIHMARYQLAAPYCAGKRVLDVACGEGYGSYILKQFGATSVAGVDNSPEAINRAQSLFSRHGIQFSLHDAQRVDELYPNQEFDVIVSLETLEHVEHPKKFLQALRNLANEQSVIIITCPNDHWYYPTDEQSNPYHLKKYSFEQFRELTTSVLGTEAVWGFGVPLIGFGTITDDLTTGKDPLLGQVAMLDFRQQASAIALPAGRSANIGPRNCSYFVGVWGGDAARMYSSAVVPVSMDNYSNLVSWEAAQLSPRRIEELEAEKSALAKDFERTRLEHVDLLRQLEASERRLEAVLHEGQRNLEAAQQEREYYRIQSLALTKELDLVNDQFKGLRRTLDQTSLYLDELQKREREQQQLHEREQQRLHELEQQLRELEQQRLRELEQQRLHELEQQRLHELEQQRLHDVEQQRLRELEQQQRPIAPASTELQLQPTASETRRNPIVGIARTWVVRVARRVRPYLPEPYLRHAQRIARRLGL